MEYKFILHNIYKTSFKDSFKLGKRFLIIIRVTILMALAAHFPLRRPFLYMQANHIRALNI